MQQLLLKGKFELKKWNSSEPTVLHSIPHDLHDTEEVLALNEESTGISKTLGICWDTRQDVFKATISEPDMIESLTKRNLLSDVSKLFDVLGWFTPAIWLMKVLIQRTWELGVGWDDPLPEELYQTWKTWRQQLHCLETVQVPRFYHNKDEIIAELQLHGFSDQSQMRLR